MIYRSLRYPITTFFRHDDIKSYSFISQNRCNPLIQLDFLNETGIDILSENDPGMLTDAQTHQK